MEIRAYQKFVRTSPRKLGLVADSVRSLPPKEALVQLEFIKKRAAGVLYKVLKQAISNAVNNQGLAADNLKIKHLQIEAGPTLKRWRAVSRGRGHRILKRMSHIKIVLEPIEEPKKAAEPKKEKSTKKPKQSLKKGK